MNDILPILEATLESKEPLLLLKIVERLQRLERRERGVEATPSRLPPPTPHERPRGKAPVWRKNTKQTETKQRDIRHAARLERRLVLALRRVSRRGGRSFNLKRRDARPRVSNAPGS